MKPTGDRRYHQPQGGIFMIVFQSRVVDAMVISNMFFLLAILLVRMEMIRLNFKYYG